MTAGLVDCVRCVGVGVGVGLLICLLTGRYYFSLVGYYYFVFSFLICMNVCMCFFALFAILNFEMKILLIAELLNKIFKIIHF